MCCQWQRYLKKKDLKLLNHNFNQTNLHASELKAAIRKILQTRLMLATSLEKKLCQKDRKFEAFKSNQKQLKAYNEGFAWSRAWES